MRNINLLKGGHVVVALSLFLCLTFGAVPGTARERTDQAVVAQPLIGHLPNGLAYYIANTEASDDKVRFELVVRVGSLHGRPASESAHVLEHIVFSKLRNVEDKGSIWQRMSRYGAFANAGTGPLSTFYTVAVPGGDDDTVSAGLDILADWVSGGAITDEEIDRETKIVIEEIRRGGSEGLSVEQIQQQTWFNGHPLLETAKRRFGTIDASGQIIRDLHRDYYVQANMAVVVTGKIDPVSMLGKMSARFASLPGAAPAPRKIIPVAARLKGEHYLPIADRESSIEISYKVRSGRSATSRARNAAVAVIVSKLAQQGFVNLAERDDASISDGILAMSSATAPLYLTDIFTARTYVRRGAIRTALSDTLNLLATLRREGFPSADIDRVKAEYIQAAVGTSPVRGDGSQWSQQFIDGMAEPSQSEIRSAMERLTPAEVNRTLRSWLSPSNRDMFVVYARRHEAQVPLEPEVPDLVAKAERSAQASFAVPSVRAPDLLAVAIEAGAIPPPAQESFGIMRWSLPRSGATLLFRRTDTRNIQLLLRRPRNPGLSDLTAASTARVASEVVSRSGLGGLGQVELNRFLDSRSLAVSGSIQMDREQVRASGPGENWGEILALARTRMIDPQCSETALAGYVADQDEASSMEGNLADDAAFAQMVEAILDPAQQIPHTGLSKLQIGKLCEQYRQTFSTTAGMTIVVEGDIPPEQVYSGVTSALDLPGKAGAPGTVQHPAAAPARGRTVMRRGSAPLAKVRLALLTNGDGSAGRLVADALGVRMFERLRVIEEGTYGTRTGFNPDIGRLTVDFECAPETMERLIAAAKDEIERIREEGLTSAELASSRRNLGEQKITAEWVARNWASRGSLNARIEPTDADVQAWSRAQLIRSDIYEFVRLPASQNDPVAMEQALEGGDE